MIVKFWCLVQSDVRIAWGQNPGDNKNEKHIGGWKCLMSTLPHRTSSPDGLAVEHEKCGWHDCRIECKVLSTLG